MGPRSKLCVIEKKKFPFPARVPTRFFIPYPRPYIDYTILDPHILSDYIHNQVCIHVILLSVVCSTFDTASVLRFGCSHTQVMGCYSMDFLVLLNNML